jgi:hypothetical protein
MRLLHIACLCVGIIAAAALMPHPAICGDSSSVVTVKAESGHFNPPQLEVTAHQPFKVRVISAEKSPIEFESFELRRERVVQPGEAITVNMPALGPGTYKFFDDFHRDTPEGVIVAK